MRLILRILKHHDEQIIPGCFLTTHAKEKSYTYSFNAPANVHKDWPYFRHTQSEQGFRVFMTRISLSRLSGLFALISQQSGRAGLNRFSFFGSNPLMRFYPYLKTCLGLKFLRMSAASFEKNNFDYVGMIEPSQIKKFFNQMNTSNDWQDEIKRIFPRNELHAAKDHITYEDNKAISIPYYEDSALRIYAINISGDNSNEKKYVYHVKETEDVKTTINKTSFEKDIPSRFRKSIITHGEIELDGKIIKLSDYQVSEPSSHFLVFDIENEQELVNFINSKYYQSYIQTSGQEQSQNIINENAGTAQQENNSADSAMQDIESQLFSKVSLIVHLSPKSVLESPTYIQFIKQTAKNNKIKHFITASGYYDKSLQQQQQLTAARQYSFLNYNNQISQLFPSIIPVCDPRFFIPWQKTANNTPIEDAPFYLKQNVWLAQHVEQIHIKNAEIIQMDLTPVTQKMHPAAVQELLRNAFVIKLREQLLKTQEASKKQSQQQLPSKQVPFSQLYPILIPLGTSSSIAGYLRNESSYFIKTNNNSAVLLDCGPSTMYQLQKQFGAGLKKEIQSIKIVFISHIHSDHHFGLADFIQQRQDIINSDKEKNNQQQQSPLLVVAPTVLIPYLESLKNLSQNDLNVEFIPHKNVSGFQDTINQANNSSTLAKNLPKLMNYFSEDLVDTDDNLIELSLDSKEQSGELLKSQQSQQAQKENHQRMFNLTLDSCNISKVTLFPIYHCLNSRSISIELRDKQKIVYSGDGRPSLKFKQFFQNVDYLIHECTFTSEFQLQASLKNHSYFDEVLRLAAQANVKCLILSHFSTNGTSQLLSQRIDQFNYSFGYQQDQQLQEYINKNTIFAADNIVIERNNMHLLPAISRVILKMQAF